MSTNAYAVLRAAAIGAALALLAACGNNAAARQTGAPEGKASGTVPVAANTPSSLVPAEPTWDSFHGQLNAQKYSPLSQITADNVAGLEKVWEFHTGDVSDGSGDTPATVWSATPIFANETLYIGTPFYRLIALDPATGEPKWTFDTHTKKKALTAELLLLQTGSFSVE